MLRVLNALGRTMTPKPLGVASPWSVPHKGWGYPHRDIGAGDKLIRLGVSSIQSSQANGDTLVVLHFSNGRRFILLNSLDSDGERSMYTVA